MSHDSLPTTHPSSPSLTRPCAGCDTLVALSGATSDASVILAKNSDRPADESQPLIRRRRSKHPPGSTVKCQYIEIPQPGETLAFIGSRPYWLWGLEHGMNECGVAVGNEAVFTKETLPEKGLLGMDLVRLGLERGRTAPEALEVMTSLLREFGQGGSGSEHGNMPYCNSFIIADYNEAFILETSGRQYAWKAVRETASVSNHIAINSDWDGLSDDAVEHALSQGWWEHGEGRFDFSAAYRSTEMVSSVISEERLRQSGLLLEEYRGRISPATMMRSLRDHYDSGTVFSPGREPDDGKCYSICMHADPVGTTAASMVAHLRGTNRLDTYWASFGTPCCGVFMPLYGDGEIPQALTRAGARFSDNSVWWLFKKLDEHVAEDYAKRTPRVQKAWAALEAEFLEMSGQVEAEAESLFSNGTPQKAKDLLTRFMGDNLKRVQAGLQSMLH